MTKILMVCLGNICRSPLAEGILKSKLPHDKFVVDSAGTAHYHIGNPPDKRSITVAKKYGIDISNLKGRQFGVHDFDEFDLIYVMDESNYKEQKLNLFSTKFIPIKILMSLIPITVKSQNLKTYSKCWMKPVQILPIPYYKRYTSKIFSIFMLNSLFIK